MAYWILVHLPHLLPPLVGFIGLAKLGIWAADQPPSQFSDEEVEEWLAERAVKKADQRRPVLASVARLGSIALVPLIAAFATGLWIYTLNLGGERPSATLIWSHTAISLAGLALTTAKLVPLGLGTLRARTSLKRPQTGLSSLVLLALGVPLALSGLWLLVEPNGKSFTDYFHLIVSVWWALLLQWHLWRYFSRAIARSLGGGVREPAPPIAGD